MTLKRLVITALLALVPIITGTGVEARPPAAPDDLSGSGPVTVGQLVRAAYERNPALKAARLSWKATVEGYRSATALPDPQLMGTYFPRPIETRLGPQDWNITLSQAVPFPGTLASAGKLVSAKPGSSR